MKIRFSFFSVIIIICILTGNENLLAQKKNDTFSVYFDLNSNELNLKARQSLDSLHYTGKIAHGIPVSIIGFADYLATEDYNLILSKERALMVKAHLEGYGLMPEDIKIVTGKGEVKREVAVDSKGFPPDRKVDIVMDYEKKVRRETPVKKGRPKPGTGREYKVPIASSSPDFDMNNLPEGSSFILDNIYFPSGKHFPTGASEPALKILLEAMQDNLSLVIQIEGHVCCIYLVPDAYDLDTRQLDLSVNRAKFIYNYLIQQGISKDRLRYIGYGKDRPIIKNERTEAEAQVNRRVEIRILKK